ncbi:MAG: MinD/ParA family protein [Cellulosilyticaceae bacterium]
MNDQAEVLRSRVAHKQTSEGKQGMRVLTVTSGKGGVGKSNFSTNLAICMKEQGYKPLILDADFGLANIEVIFGARPQYHLAHYLEELCSMETLICQSDYGVPFISGGSGVREMLFLENHEVQRIAGGLSNLESYADTLIIDTGAGINEIVLKFCEIADEILVVVTPEPASITDAYALIKTLTKALEDTPVFKMIINKVDSAKEADGIYHKLSYVARQFLDVTLEYGGYIPYDAKLFEAVKLQKPVLVYDHKALSSRAYERISREIFNEECGVTAKTKENWLEKFKKAFSHK